MNAELKQALEVIKKHCDTPKGKSFYEHMDGASLKQRIETLKSQFINYVDHQTIWYHHNQIAKKQPGHFEDHPDYMKVELTKKQREDCLQALRWFENDIKACISHLKD
jgi:hypothetical protein